MKFTTLLLAASIPVVKVIMVTLVGTFIALKRINILNEDGRNHLNKVAFYVFTPALVYANLAKTLTLHSFITLGLILGCCSAGNLGNMLVIIIPAVCKEKGSPFGDHDVCLKFGMAYASLSMAIGSIYLWLYVYNIMRISSSKMIEEIEGSVNGVIEGSLSISSRNGCEPQLQECSISEDNVEGPGSNKFKQQLKMLAKKINLKRLLAPPTIGAIAGFIVGVIPPFRRLMIGESAPLHVIQDSAFLLGDGTIPTVSLIMGGNLTRGLKGSEVHIPVIIGILIVRNILLPLFGIFIVKGAIHFGMVSSDPLYNFVLLLQFTLPPAMSISTISQLFGAGQSECSVIMLWTYAFASVSLALWTILFMWLVS
ncbi:hypothetical protein AQUCO_09500016v1 [Aquilegia coerulea]|uniref:Auxin efflux carrier n=1 Tax=Aquilegia coerulea TaxID=218851 RepID=A0A2G5C4T8_AQUCA|nr:hypothetical protein AQUCO_09500016v1 [Aquilegia coerulea]